MVHFDGLRLLLGLFLPRQQLLILLSVQRNLPLLPVFGLHIPIHKLHHVAILQYFLGSFTALAIRPWYATTLGYKVKQQIQLYQGIGRV